MERLSWKREIQELHFSLAIYENELEASIPKIHSGRINDQGAVHARTSRTVRNIHIPLPLLHRDSYTEIFEFLS